MRRGLRTAIFYSGHKNHGGRTHHIKDTHRARVCSNTDGLSVAKPTRQAISPEGPNAVQEGPSDNQP